MRYPIAHAEFAGLTKSQLHDLADRLLISDANAMECCIAFVLAESKGLWHGRARAMMCRRLKHCELGQDHRTKLVACILDRLRSGAFSEQFKDQLRLALHLDPGQTRAACDQALSSARPHVRRYAAWVIALPRRNRAI